MDAVCLTWKCVCLLFPKTSMLSSGWSFEGGAHELSFPLPVAFGNEESAKIHSWETCMALVPEPKDCTSLHPPHFWKEARVLGSRKHPRFSCHPAIWEGKWWSRPILWGNACTATWHSTTFLHGHFTCKLFLQNMHCWLPVLYWECLLQGVLIGTLLTTVLAP